MRSLIIGAGASGLAAAHRFSAAGLSYDWVDDFGQVGGIWDRTHPKSPIYESVRPITSHFMTGYPGHSMNGDGYPTNSEMLGYLRSFFEERQDTLAPLRRATVRSIEVNMGRPRWRVHFNECDSASYDSVVDATGLTNRPRLPSERSLLAGQIHSADYRSGSQLDGQRVLVIGGGNSAFHIATECGKVADAQLSLQRGYWLAPMFVGGAAADRPKNFVGQNAGEAEQLTLKKELSPLCRALYDHGYPEPDHLPLERGLVVCDELLPSLDAGSLLVRPPVIQVDGHKVTFANGDVQHFDTVVFATGYDPSPGLLVGQRPSERNFALSCISKHYPLYFIVGATVSDIGGYWVADQLAQLVAMVIGTLRSCRDEAELESLYFSLARQPYDLCLGARLAQPHDGTERVLGRALLVAIRGMMRRLKSDLELHPGSAAAI